MTLPADLTTCIVTGTFLDSAGYPQRGYITFTPSAELADATGAVVIPQVTRTYQLSGQGSFTTEPLVATDAAAVRPQGWTYAVALCIRGLPPQQWNILLPASAVPVDISGITPAVSQGATSSYLPQAGGTLTGTLTLDGSPPLRAAAGAAAGDVLTSDSSGNASWQPAPGITGTVTIGQGGTGATTAAGALANLGAAQALVPVALQASAYTAAPGNFVPASTASGPVTITLPAAPASGTVIGVKMAVQSGANAVTITRSGSDVFNVSGGSTSLTLGRLNQTVVVLYASGVWYVSSTDPAIALDATAGDIAPVGTQAAGSTGKAADAGHVHATPMTAAGDTLYGGTSGTPARLAGNTSATKNFYTQTGTGSASAAPAWATIAPGDLPAATTSAQGAIELGGGTSDFLRADGTWAAPPGTGGGGGTVSAGGTGVTSLVPYAPVTGGTTSTGAVQQAASQIATPWNVLMSQGASAVPVWGPPTLADSNGGLWELKVSTSGTLSTWPALQDEAYGALQDQAYGAMA